MHSYHPPKKEYRNKCDIFCLKSHILVYHLLFCFSYPDTIIKSTPIPTDQWHYFDLIRTMTPSSTEKAHCLLRLARARRDTQRAAKRLADKQRNSDELIVVPQDLAINASKDSISNRRLSLSEKKKNVSSPSPIMISYPAEP